MSAVKKSVPSVQSIELRSVTKRFPGVLANDSVSLSFESSRVHTLLGENGAGKSTLMHVMYGMYAPDEGQILVNGSPVHFRSPKDAAEYGIGMVHQHFMLVPSLSVLENIVLNYPSPRWPLLDLAAARERVLAMSNEYGFGIDPDAKVWQLSVGEQQRVEILRILFRDASYIILDEPTAVLTPLEVKEFMGVLRRLVADGHGIVFITHKLNEALEISDKITVLRSGKVVGETTPCDTDKNQLAGLMVGREVVPTWQKRGAAGEKVILSVRNLSARNNKGLRALNDVSFDLKEGEVLAVAGVSGNGQKELAETIAGLRRIDGGEILLGGSNLAGLDVKQRIDSGLAFIPEERMTMGVVKEFSLIENVILKSHGTPEFASGIFLRAKKIRDSAVQAIKDFDVRTPSADVAAATLSGGNIQKVILARELSSRPKLLIAAQPTRGVDIGASEYIHKRIVQIRNEGVPVLLISEDLDEIISLADRVLVLYEGQVQGIVPPSTPVEEIGLMMTGGNTHYVVDGCEDSETPPTTH